MKFCWIPFYAALASLAVALFSYVITHDFTHEKNKGETIYSIFTPMRGGGLFGGMRDGFWTKEYKQDGNCFSDPCGRKFCSEEYSIEPARFSPDAGYSGGVCFLSFPL